MRIYFSFFLFFLFFFLSGVDKLQAQIGNSSKPRWKRDTIVGDNVFKEQNNWVSGGAGVGKNSQFGGSQFAGGLDYNFHLRMEYFQFGVLVTGDQFGEYNNYEFHLCYGKRKENVNYNFSYYGGLSYCFFYQRFAPNDYSENSTNAIGLYGNAQLIYKLTYDVGIGPGVFIDINTKEVVEGLKLDLYFSGAYRGKKDTYY